MRKPLVVTPSNPSPRHRTRSAAEQMAEYRAQLEDIRLTNQEVVAQSEEVIVPDVIRRAQEAIAQRDARSAGRVDSYRPTSVERNNTHHQLTAHEVLADEPTANNDANPIKSYAGKTDEYGRPHGKGTATYANGDHYSGLFVGGIREGRGHMQYHDGTRYWGWFKDNNRYGVEAVQITPRGDKYYGHFLRDKYHGEGTWTYPNGLYGKGVWEDGKNKYWNGLENEVGSFEDNFGTYDGLFYVKRTKDSLGFTVQNYVKEGNGVMSYRNGDVYTGPWYDNKRDSNPEQVVASKMEYSDGRVYTGLFKSDMKHGKGLMTYPNGSLYEGSWFNDMRSGLGRYVNAEDDAEYVGRWFNDTRHGHGKIVISNNFEPYHSEVPLYATRKITLQGAVFDGEFNADSIVNGTLKLSPDEYNVHQFVLSGPMNHSLALNGVGTFMDHTLNITYKGPFIEGRRHGAFEVTEGDDNVFATEYRNDVETRSISSSRTRSTVSQRDSTSRSSKSDKSSIATSEQRESTTTRSSRMEDASVTAPSESESARSSRSETVSAAAPRQEESPKRERTEKQIFYLRMMEAKAGKRKTASAAAPSKGKSAVARKRETASAAAPSRASKRQESPEALSPVKLANPRVTCAMCKKLYTLEQANLLRIPESPFICSPCLVNVILAQGGPTTKKARK